jgi:DNA repair protein RecO (recombination protein O)
LSEKIDGDPAFVLHARPWRETSLIIDVLTRHHGRIGIVARGARRQSSGLKTRLIPFQPLSLSWFGKSAVAHAARRRMAGRRPDVERPCADLRLLSQ